jgi:hypothetical protein
VEYREIDGTMYEVQPDGALMALPANEVNWTKTARTFSERRDYRREYLAKKVGATASVTLGRGDLDSETWAEYRDDIDIYLASAMYDTNAHVERSERWSGVGYWNGIQEENYHVIFHYKRSLTETEIENLRDKLAQHANFYGQEAIALTIGTTELVSGK